MSNINELIKIIRELEKLFDFNFKLFMYQETNEKIRNQVESEKNFDLILEILIKNLTKMHSEAEKIEIVSLYFETLKLVNQFIASNLFGSKNINMYIYKITNLIKEAPKLGYRPDQIEAIKQDLIIDTSKRDSLTSLDNEIRRKSYELFNLEKTFDEI